MSSYNSSLEVIFEHIFEDNVYFEKTPYPLTEVNKFLETVNPDKFGWVYHWRARYYRSIDNIDLCVSNYQKSIEYSNTYSMLNLAIVYLNSGQSSLQKGTLFQAPQIRTQGIELLNKAADLNNPLAMFRLAKMHIANEFKEKTDLNLAMDLLIKSYNLGERDTLIYIADLLIKHELYTDNILLFITKHVDEDDDMLIDWLTQSVNDGHVIILSLLKFAGKRIQELKQNNDQLTLINSQDHGMIVNKLIGKYISN